MGFAVLHITKGTKGSCKGLENHIDRKVKVPNADPNRKDLNFYIRANEETRRTERYSEVDKPTLKERIENRITYGYKGNKAIRADAVKYINIVISGSHDEMLEIVKHGKITKWASDNYAFVAKNFGGYKNIVEFSVHMDERTPHIHCVLVPLTEDGRLSAKEIMGNSVKLSELQTAHGNAMAMFNLERGVKGSTATHETVKEYYARIDDRMNPQNTHLQNAELVDRMRKENCQLKGVIKEQDKKLNPEKYQDKNKPGINL